MSGLCEDCRARKAADEVGRGVLHVPEVMVAAGGWCAPMDDPYQWPEPECAVIESRPYESFLPQRKKVTRKRALKAHRRWLRHEAMVGEIAHGYVRFGDLIPEVVVRRGGITFANVKPTDDAG